MLRIHDCSNSAHRPAHRGSGGPVENDVVANLKLHAPRFGAEFVADHRRADVVFTNDVFPPHVLATGRPRVKRMDGVFWRADLVARNAPLNEAARLADHVVFISEHSRDSYFALYGEPLAACSVAANAADPLVFPAKLAHNRAPRRWVAVANDWARPEKRPEETLRFAGLVDELVLVGRCDRPVPRNVSATGYLTAQQDIAAVLRSCDAMLCLSHRDPCPKTVAQAVASGLPVLYAASGGVAEMLGQGVAVPDADAIAFGTGVPPMDPDAVEAGLREFESRWDSLAAAALKTESRFEAMLAAYFAAFRDAAGRPSRPADQAPKRPKKRPARDGAAGSARGGVSAASRPS